MLLDDEHGKRYAGRLRMLGKKQACGMWYVAFRRTGSELKEVMKEKREIGRKYSA